MAVETNTPKMGILTLSDCINIQEWEKSINEAKRQLELFRLLHMQKSKSLSERRR